MQPGNAPCTFEDTTGFEGDVGYKPITPVEVGYL